MEKYNWKDDAELELALSDSTSTPRAVSKPKFDSLYRFVIQRHTGPVEVKEFVPEWGLPIVIATLDKDTTIKNYFYTQTYKGT